MRGNVDPFIVMDVMENARKAEESGRKIIHMEVGQPSSAAPSGALERTSQIIKNSFPDNYSDLIKLPGIDTDSANMMLSEIYNIPSVILNDHIMRIVKLLKLTRNNDSIKIRVDIAEIFEQKIWAKVTYLIAKHGEQICIEIKPKCEKCILNKLCPSSSV